MGLVWVRYGPAVDSTHANDIYRLDGTGIARSVEFHWLLGPILFVSFAILGNTLFLTILVSTLSNTFARITHHSVAEIQFRKAVLTFEGVKSDALFSYPPPFNIAALILLWPLKLVVTDRWFHKVNITAVRILNAPVLLLIGLYERKNLWPMHKEAYQYHSTQNRLGLKSWTWFHAHAHIGEVFDSPPEDEPELMPDQPDERRPSDDLHPRSHRSSNENEDKLKKVADRMRRISISLPSNGPVRPPKDAYSQTAFGRRRGSTGSGGSEMDPQRRLERRLARIEELLGQISDAIEDTDEG